MRTNRKKRIGSIGAKEGVDIVSYCELIELLFIVRISPCKKGAGEISE